MWTWSVGRGSSWGDSTTPWRSSLPNTGLRCGRPRSFVCVAVAAELVLGFALALALKDRFSGRAFALTALLVPMMLPSAVIALFWKLVLNGHYGILNQCLGALGLGPTSVDYRSRPQAAVDFAG